MAHKSISRFHAAVIFDKVKGPCLLDLNSKAGSYIDSVKLKPNIPEAVMNKSEITFGKSTRSYRLNIDFTPVERQLKKKITTISKDLKILDVLE